MSVFQYLAFMKEKRKENTMKLMKRLTALFAAVSMLPVFATQSTAEGINIASGKSLTNNNGSYILDLERAYPVDSIELSGVNSSSAVVKLSNDPEFPENSILAPTNIALNKPVMSKLYGAGGYTSDYAVKYAVDGNASTQFISTPKMSAVEWITIDLEDKAIINSISINMSANRTYSVEVTNTKFGQEEEFTDGVRLIETSSKNFILPDEYKNSAFRYVRLRFAGDAPSDYYLDTNMYVNEITVNGSFGVENFETITMNKNGSLFTQNNMAKDNYYRYAKISGVSSTPTVKVNVNSEFADCINVASDAEISIPSGAVVYDDLSADRVIDNNYETLAAFNHNTPYIQFDLHEKQAISHIEVYCRQDILSDRNNLRVLLSNSPDFDDYIVLGEQQKEESIGIKAAYVKGRRNIFETYRYVRVCNGGNTFFVLAEVKIFANKGYENVYNVAVDEAPVADVNTGYASRATDSDAETLWKGKSLTISLDRCYTSKVINITATGDIKLTYGCKNGEMVTKTISFGEKDTKSIFYQDRINQLKLEGTDEIIIYNAGVYVDGVNAYINKVIPEKVNKLTEQYNVIDLGRQIVIDHIEPCNIEAKVSATEDFNETNTLKGCEIANVTARYILQETGTDVTVIGYDSPELVHSPEGKKVIFKNETSGDAKAFAAVYNEDSSLKFAVTADASEGEMTLPDGNSASFMMWDKVNMKPLFPKIETKYVNKIPQAVFYVDPDVSTSGDGSEFAPFMTIPEAQEAVRNINSSMTGDIIVNLKGGRYYLDSTLEFTTADGGTNGYRVIYRNADGETPVITGGKKITGFNKGANGIWTAVVSGFSNIYELMVNGEVANIAKTEEPIKADSFYNKGTSFRYDGISFSADKLPKLSNGENVFVHTTRSWMDVMLKATAVSKANGLVNIDIIQPKFDDVTGDSALSGHRVTPDADFYIENAYELLDNPGEFYFHNKKKVLYYMPREGEDMTTATVEAPVLETLVKISGAGKSDHIENLAISGIRFENSTFDKMYKYGFRTAQAQVIVFDNGIFLDGAIQVDYATGIEISDCVITGVTKSAISMGNGVIDSKIRGNRIYNVAESAIVMGRNLHNEITGNEELCQRVTVSDNVINKVGQKFKGAPAISCYYVTDVDVLHNKITECNYSGICVGWGWDDYPESTTCQRNRIAYNYIENYNLVATDGGAIYLLGQQPGTVIENNYMVQHKVPMQMTGISGIYPDEGSSYMTIRNNVIDMLEISNYGGAVRDINMWVYTVKDNFAHDNFVTYTNVRNDGTSCMIEEPVVFENSAKPAEVERIIATSAINLD